MPFANRQVRMSAFQYGSLSPYKSVDSNGILGIFNDEIGQKHDFIMYNMLKKLYTNPHFCTMTTKITL